MGSDHIRSQQRARVISKWIDVAQVCCIEEFTQLIADIFFFKGIACSEKLLFLESHHLCITIQSYLSPQARLGSCSQRQGKLYHSSMTGVIDPILVVIIVCIVKSVSARLVFSLFYIESRFSISIFCQDWHISQPDDDHHQDTPPPALNQPLRFRWIDLLVQFHFLLFSFGYFSAHLRLSFLTAFSPFFSWKFTKNWLGYSARRTTNRPSENCWWRKVRPSLPRQLVRMTVRCRKSC